MPGGASQPWEEGQDVPPVRLLFVLPSEVRGGAEEVVLALLQGFEKRPFELALACPQALLKSLGRDLASLNVRTLAVQPSSWLYFRDVFRLAAFMRNFRPDVVNTHLFRATFVAAPLAKLLGVPLVIETYHGREAWRKRVLTRWFWVDRVVLRFVDRVVAVSSAARDFLVRSKWTPAEKIIVVPNGRELSVFKPGSFGEEVRRELSIAPGTPLVGVVGRLEPQKGHEYLLEAMPTVLARIPEARLLIVGSGTLESALRLRTSALGIEDRVSFLGYRQDVIRVMDALDVVVMPSLYEGMPLIAIEAAAMAKPIVASRVDGTEEVVVDGETGLLVPPADPQRLAKALLDILTDGERRAAMGDRARKLAVQRFDVRNQVATTAQFYWTEFQRVSRNGHPA